MKRKPKAKPKKPDVDPREQRFVAAYFLSADAKKAALEAGYSKTFAEGKAYALLKRPEIVAALAKQQAKVDRKVLASAQKLHEDWSDMWDADIADIIDEKTGAYKPIHQWPILWRRMIRGMEVRELFEHSTDGKASKSGGWDKIGELVKIRFVEMTKLAELLGKHKDVDAFVAQKVEGKLELEVTLKEITARLQAGRDRLAKRNG